jgi:PIN domain nuclease of toxin-antitoxin system
LLLDTCTLLWLVAERGRLSARAKRLIAEHAGSLFLSAISAFEIALKHRKGRLTLPLTPANWIASVLEFHGVVEIPVDCDIAARSVALPQLHDDPCDRIIVATAQARGLTILTPDPLIRAYRPTGCEW